jgi:hypothetical protein
VRISKQIAETIYLLRRTPQIDIERLTYELSEEEWHEFARELDSVNQQSNDLSYADRCLFMGLTVSKRASLNTSDAL